MSSTAGYPFYRMGCPCPEQRQRPQRATLVFDVENATTVMETEYGRRGAERTHQVAIASGMDMCKTTVEDLGSFSASLSVNYARTDMIT